MNYIYLINRFWKMNLDEAFTAQETFLYFRLLHICNQVNWRSFKRSNFCLCAETNMTEVRLISARNKLIETGLIGFTSGKKKREPSTYTILTGNEINTGAETGIGNKSNIDPDFDVNRDDFSGSDSVNDSEFNSLFYTVNDTQSESVTDSEFESIIDRQSDSAFFQKSTDNKRVINKNINSNNKFKEKRKKEVLPASAGSFNAKKIMEEYNLICTRLPKVKEFSKSRQKATLVRLFQHGPEKVREVFRLAAQSDFLAGSNERNWFANFDWIMKPANFVKILEGYYANREKNIYNNPASNLEVLEEVYNDIIENGDFTN